MSLGTFAGDEDDEDESAGRCEERENVPMLIPTVKLDAF